MMNFLERLSTIIKSIKDKTIALVNRKKRSINIDVFANPGKYSVRLPMDKIVADPKVSPEGVELYKTKIKNGEKLKPIIVVKHPEHDVYAVLDGHHRYYAYLELGKKEITCALAGDFSGVFFYMTEHGFFQPNPEAKEPIREPEMKFHDNIQQFLHNFLKDPSKTKQARV
jgi:hypothetical protein